MLIPMRVLLLTLLVVATSSCGSSLVLSYTGTDRNFEVAERVASEFREICHEDVFVVRGGSFVPLVGVHVVRDLEGDERAEKAGATVYDASGPRGIQFADDDRAVWVLPHEIGHALGYIHTSRGIMLPGGRVSDITTDDCQ